LVSNPYAVRVLEGGIKHLAFTVTIDRHVIFMLLLGYVEAVNGRQNNYRNHNGGKHDLEIDAEYFEFGGGSKCVDIKNA
jgi:hypothetical protein